MRCHLSTNRHGYGAIAIRAREGWVLPWRSPHRAIVGVWVDWSMARPAILGKGWAPFLPYVGIFIPPAVSSFLHCAAFGALLRYPFLVPLPSVLH
ncbi:hypothetical protein HNQ60_001313 [Povalibacter uvarum]|uniref:Uncharacterized protein n=1 Tax=Povalibacter uvarum TaxID=732238 RepID=A0A841HK87_9GAMM|nr:hypothetical protein [Povalibacter uvarum]